MNYFRYCSNLYPKAESYKICNWCLSQTDDTKEKSQNSSNSSSSNKSQTERNGNTKKSDNLANLKGQRGTLQLKLDDPIKKQRSPAENSPSPTPSPTTRRRLITRARMEEKLRRTKSEEMANRIGVTRQVFRNKVRRYKLLDEVSS